MLDLHGGMKNSCDVFFYEVARRTGIDRSRQWRIGSAWAWNWSSICPGSEPD